MPENFDIELYKSIETDTHRAMALGNLIGGQVPEYAIQSHPGKGGKVMRYISHVWITDQLNAAFGMLWDMKTTNPVVYSDGSATVEVTLTVTFPLKDGSTRVKSITEIGAFDGGGGKMTKAMMVASAASRGLVRCAYRMFGVGAELYEDTTVTITPGIAWERLKKYGKSRGLSDERIIELMKKGGFTRDNLLDKFEEAWFMVYVASVHDEDADVSEL